MLHIGIIGCGGMGSTHNKAYKSAAQKHDVAVVALADCRQEFLDQAQLIWPQAETYTNGIDLINKAHVDAVSICLPSHMHTDHAVRAMEKGIAVLIEKPVCITEDECKRLLETQAKTGTPAMVGHVLRFFDEYAFLKKAFDKQLYGELLSIDMKRLGGDVLWGFEDWFHDEKKSGSVMLDLHIHDVDFLHYLLGNPDAMEIETEAFPSGLINHVVAHYRFASVRASAEGLWDPSPNRPFEASFTAVFEKGKLSFCSSKNPSLTITLPVENDNLQPLMRFAPLHSDITDVTMTGLDPYCKEINYFTECLIEGKPIEQATLQDGVDAVRLVLKEQNYRKS